MALQRTQLISVVSLILSLAQWVVATGDSGKVLLLPNEGSRPAMILPLHHSVPDDSSVSDFSPRRQLQRSQSQRHPDARMRLYDDLLRNGYYTTRLWIGTPPQRFALIVDTGSTVTYVPCSTCQHCGKHQDPKFQPEDSETYQPVKCTWQCNCDTDRKQCTYERRYAEMSTSSGVLGEDVISFGNQSELSPQRATFGCENDETGDLYTQHADGIMGLGRGDLSIMDQLVEKKVISDAFSLCYGGMGVGGGAMVLGGISPPADMVFTHSDPGRSPYYNINLKEVHVAGKRLNLNPKVFDGKHGAVLDSGTTYAYLPESAFLAFKHQPCTPFVKKDSEMFGFTQGCLPVKRWDELHNFFEKAGAKIIFGLNALAGKSIHGGSATGPWNSTNAESFIRYNVRNGYTIYGWELGNELSGSGVGTSITADQYASDFATLRDVVYTAYKEIDSKPLVIAPGGFFDATWFREFISKSGKALDVVSHHIYNLGPGVDEHLVEKILDPSFLDMEASTFSGLKNILASTGTSATAWVGESGGAYNSGHHLVSDAFVYSFWYLDQLGMSAAYNTKTYCRQSLIGGNYGLLNTTNFLPNPDYYSALLWHRLMGRNVLSTTFSGTKMIRAYAHCAKQSKGITVLLINLDGNTSVEADVTFDNNAKSLRKMFSHSNMMELPLASETAREEYHLTPQDGNIHSQIMVLNGKPLRVNSAGDIPPLDPIYVNSSEPINVAPFSIVFAHLPHVVVTACG